MRPSIPTSVILDAAAALVADRGFDDVRMEDVAARAGVAKGVLYLRFAGKDALLVAIVRRELALATRATAELVAADPRGGLLSRLFVHSVDALRSRPALLRFYRDDLSPVGRLARNRDDDHRPRALLGATLVEELQRVGTVDPHLDAAVLAANLTVWSRGLVTRAHGDDVEELVLGMADLVARGADLDVGDTADGSDAILRFTDALIADLESP